MRQRRENQERDREERTMRGEGKGKDHQGREARGIIMKTDRPRRNCLMCYVAKRPENFANAKLAHTDLKVVGQGEQANPNAHKHSYETHFAGSFDSRTSKKNMKRKRREKKTQLSRYLVLVTYCTRTGNSDCHF